MDEQEYKRLLWHMITTHYRVALDYQTLKPKLDEIVRTNDQFNRAGAMVRWLVYAIVGLVGMLYSLRQAAEIWQWIKGHH